MLCEEFLEVHLIISVNGTFFTVDGMVHDENSLRKEIYDPLRPFVMPNLTKHVTSVLGMLRLESFVPDLPIQTDRIHVQNGTLYLDGRFTEEKQFCLNRLPVAFIYNAHEPRTWLKFLDDLLEPEDVMTLQEFLGYCLIPSNRGQKMLLLRGNGGEGKSRIGIVMQRLFGVNLKNGSISKIEQSPFARADLEHSLVMIDDDAKLEALKSTHYLKSLITAEMPMDLEKKGKQSYQGNMYVRFLAFSNGGLESLYDRSDGFYRRQLILSVKRRPEGRRDDPYIADKMCKEIERILIWCLAGLVRLMQNNFRFTESSRTLENRAEAKRDSDNVLAFVRSEGYVRLNPKGQITSQELYRAYTEWCDDNVCRQYSARTVSITLKNHAEELGIIHSSHILNRCGKQVNGFLGIESCD